MQAVVAARRSGGYIAVVSVLVLNVVTFVEVGVELVVQAVVATRRVHRGC